MFSQKPIKIRFPRHFAMLLCAAVILVAASLIIYSTKVRASSLSITHAPASANLYAPTNHTFAFTSVSAVPADGFVTIHFSEAYVLPPGIDFTDVDFSVDGVQRNLGASASSINDGISFSQASFQSSNLQIHLNGQAGIPAGAQVEIRIGTNAAHGQAGDKQIVNPSAPSTGYFNIETNTPAAADMARIDYGTGAMFLRSPPGINIYESDGSSAVSEAGLSDTYFISLNSAPAADVTVYISADSQLKTDQSAVLFNKDNWYSQQRTVRISAADDANIEGAHTGTITHTVSSADSNYNGIIAKSLTVQIEDNDISPPSPPSPPANGSSTTGDDDDGNAGSPPGGGSPPGSPPGDSDNNGGDEDANEPQISFLDFPGNNKKFLEDEFTGKIIEFLNSMVEEGVYEQPQNKLLKPQNILKHFFAAQIALALGGKNCGETISEETCLAAAAENGFVDEGRMPASKISRADYFKMLLAAKGIPLTQKDQLSKKVCSDVSNKSQYAQVMATMLEHDIMQKSKNGSCKPKSTLTRYSALLYAVLVSEIEMPDEDM